MHHTRAIILSPTELWITIEYVLGSAKGAKCKSLGQRPRLGQLRKLSAEGAQCDSIPNIEFVVFDSIRREKLTVFVLEADPFVMLFLAANVSLETSNI